MFTMVAMMCLTLALCGSKSKSRTRIFMCRIKCYTHWIFVHGINKLCTLNICAQYKNLCVLDIDVWDKKLQALNMVAWYKNYVHRILVYGIKFVCTRYWCVV